MMQNAYAVIMAGGRGERFWPLSTSKRPKQVLSLVGNKPMISMAVDYLQGLIPAKRILIITSADLVDVICEAVPELPRENVIGEPFGRDTAAVVALASAVIKAKDPNAAFCILTADHIIRDLPVFRSTLRECLETALCRDVLFTIGIKPYCPNTGYGYIKAGKAVDHRGRIDILSVDRFVEKPDLKTARRYLEAGNYYWNSGMFVWSVEAIQKALAAFQPRLFEMATRMTMVAWTRNFNATLKKEYGKLQKISIDYAIMEKASNINMAIGTFRWDDVGAWSALSNYFDMDNTNNVFVGKCEAIDSESNIVVSNERLTALIGVRDLVVVQAGNATLVCAKDRAQEVKKMVQLLGNKGKYTDVL